MLVLSTAHLPLKEFQSLENDKDKSYRFVNHEYGAILILGGEFEDHELTPESALNTILKYSIKNDILYIDFDQDAEVCSEFATFDW